MTRKTIRAALLGATIAAVSLLTLSLAAPTAKADATGTWTGTCTDQTSPADFHYDVTLDITGTGGTLTLTCTSVDVKMSGYEAAQGMVSTTVTCDIETTMTDATHLTLYAHTTSGIYPYYMTLNGDTMTGGSVYSGATQEPNTWTFQLTRGGFLGALSLDSLTPLMAPAAAIGAIGGGLGLAVSFIPTPQTTASTSPTRNFKARTRPAPRHTHPPVRYRPRPYENRPPPPPTTTTRTIPPPPLPTPLANPANTLGMPLLPPTTTGNTPVPQDAPMQYADNQYPTDYPYPQGTSVIARCPYCGCQTLTPFTAGWLCTNPLCPARREWVLHRCTHSDFNYLTRRGL